MHFVSANMCCIPISDITTSFHDGYFAVVSRLFVVFSLSYRSLCEVTKRHKRIQFEVELAYASVFINVKSPTYPAIFMHGRVAIVAFCVITRHASLCIS